MNVMDRAHRMRWREEIVEKQFRNQTFFEYRVLNRLPDEAKYTVMFYHDGFFEYFENVNSFRVYKKVVIDVFHLVNKTKIPPLNPDDILTTKFLVAVHNPYWFQEQTQEIGIANLMIYAYSNVLETKYKKILQPDEKKIRPKNSPSRKVTHICNKYARFDLAEPLPAPVHAFIQLGFTYYTGEVPNWKAGVATQAKNLNDLDAIASLIVVVPVNGPNYVFILFKDDIPAIVKVIITEAHSVTAESAVTAVRVGPGIDIPLSVMYKLQSYAPRDNDTIVHIIVYPEEDETIPFRYHIFGAGCYHFSEKPKLLPEIENARKEQWWDGSTEMCEVIFDIHC